MLEVPSSCVEADRQTIGDLTNPESLRKKRGDTCFGLRESPQLSKNLGTRADRLIRIMQEHDGYALKIAQAKAEQARRLQRRDENQQGAATRWPRDAHRAPCIAALTRAGQCGITNECL